MISFVWRPVFETGVESIDNQHRMLVEIINRLGQEMIENRLDRELLCSKVDQLSDYASYHFQEEEQLMTGGAVDTRHCEQHSQDHQTFVTEVSRLRGALWQEPDRAGANLLDYLVHWLAYHILGEDQSMIRQLNAIHSGQKPSAVYLAEQEKNNDANEPLLAALKVLFRQVSQRNSELEQLNQVLEQRVAERTQDLLAANRDLEVLALTDVLTGLPNRRHAMRQLAELWKETLDGAGSLACIVVDADNFKEMNDTYGHDAGDVVLQELARELKHSVRSDDIVCRMGGDEFLIICPATPLGGAMHVAESVRSRVAALEVQAGEGCWHGSISVGVAANDREMSGIDELIKAADDGVYKAKRGGRNRVATRQVIVP